MHQWTNGNIQTAVSWFDFRNEQVGGICMLRGSSDADSVHVSACVSLLTQAFADYKADLVLEGVEGASRKFHQPYSAMWGLLNDA